MYRRKSSAYIYVRNCRAQMQELDHGHVYVGKVYTIYTFDFRVYLYREKYNVNLGIYWVWVWPPGAFYLTSGTAGKSQKSRRSDISATHRSLSTKRCTRKVINRVHPLQDECVYNARVYIYIYLVGQYL